jgi:hypothetical protein
VVGFIVAVVQFIIGVVAGRAVEQPYVCRKCDSSSLPNYSDTSYTYFEEYRVVNGMQRSR